MYVKNWLKDHVTIAEKNDYGLLWIKLSKNILKYDINTYIGYLYAREKNSRIFHHEEVDYYELLETDIVKYQLLGKVLVTGDFNGRTGSGSDYILHDRYIEAGLDESIRLTDIPVRFNKDHVTVYCGKRLLELCKTTNFLIANGRLGSDKDIGNFTYTSEKGCSVVDYLLLPLTDFDIVSSFEVCDVTEFSDHAGLTFTLHCPELFPNEPETEQIFTCTRKLKWDNDKLENFTLNVSKLSDLFQSLSLSLEQDDSENNINENLDKFSESLYGCSDESFGQTIRTTNISTQPKQNTNGLITVVAQLKRILIGLNIHLRKTVLSRTGLIL